MAQAQGQMEQSAARVPMIVAVAKSGTACSSRGDHAGIADLGHRSGEICYEAGG